MDKTCLSIWSQIRAFNIKDQKPLKWKHARGESLQRLRILPTSWVPAIEWNFLLKIPRGSLKQDHIKHYRVKRPGIRENYFFSLSLAIGLIWADCHTNQLQATKGFLSATGTTGFLWHLSLPTPRVAPLFQRKAVQALTPATTPALLPKTNHILKERMFSLAGSETFKDSSNWMQPWYGARK